jgi:tetratricopeptide (TPR) repeat protein
VAKVQSPDTPPAAVIAALEPQVKQFAGLPTTWVVDAMAQLACAYAEQGKADLASAIYKQIDTLYPGSNYQAQAVAGLAEMSLKAGKIDEALAAVKPIIEQANKDIAPSPADGAIYANAFLVYGQALEAQNKPRQALEAYLTVKTMFYQNPNLADQAVLLAKNLREHHPGLGIE